MKRMLRQVRESQNKTQLETAEKVGIALMSYLRYENGERLPRIDIAFALAKELNCPVEVLFKETLDAL